MASMHKSVMSILLLATLYLVPHPAQTNQGEIQAEARVFGTVVLNNAGVQNARVDVHPLTDSTESTTIITDKSGNYELEGLDVTGIQEEERNKPQKNKVHINANPGETHHISTYTEKEPVRVTIFNELGQRVKELDFNYIQNTANTFWDGTNKQGEKVSQGRYFSVIETPTEIKTGKILQQYNGKQGKQEEQTHKTTARKIAEIEETPYVFHISPTDSSSRDFFAQIDTFLIQEGIQQIRHDVETFTDKVDYNIIIEDIYTKEKIEGITVTWINENGTHQGTTDENGKIFFEDVTGAEVYFVNIDGKQTYVDIENSKAIIFQPDSRSDTIRTQIYGIMRRELPVPGEEEGTTVSWSKEIWMDYFNRTADNPEMALRGTNIYLAMNEDQKRTFYENKALMDSLFFMDGKSPFVIVNAVRDFREIDGYNPFTNYHEGKLGFNVRRGEDKTSLRTAMYGDGSVIMGGEISISGEINAFYKEMLMRSRGTSDGNSGIRKTIAEPPTLENRAYIQADILFEEYYWNNKELGKLNHPHKDYLVE